MANPHDSLFQLQTRVKRALSSVVGVALMIAIVVILSSVVAGMILTFDDKLQDPSMEDEGASVNPWDNDDNLLAPKDPSAGATDVKYRVVFEVKDSNMVGDSLNELEISVDSTSVDMFGGVHDEDIETFEVEKTDSTVLDLKSEVEDESNWALQEGGSEVEMTFTGNVYTNPQLGDVITIIFTSVDNPKDPGTYPLSVTLNQGEDKQSGTLEIID